MSSYAIVTSGGPGVRFALLTEADFFPPVPELIDTPFIVDPHGVVEDIYEWLWSSNQGPDISFSPDGNVRFNLKSDEVSAEGVAIGEHWDRDDVLVGHLDDASTGRRIYQGQNVTAEDWVAMGEPVPWSSLPLNHNWFSDGARLWLTRRCVSGYRKTYVTDISWSSGDVQHNVEIEIRIDVGYGVIHGREVRVRGAYIPGGNPEWNFYGPPKGKNAWVAHHTGPTDPWSARP